MGSKWLSAARLKTILNRQVPTRWGPHYLPSIMASKGEVPSLSRCCPIFSAKLRRILHLLSPAERLMAILALYHPAVMEVHEQTMLHPLACEHPLVGFRGKSSLGLPPLRGLVAVAEERGLLAFLPTITVPGQDGSRDRLRIVFPFIGDLLVFLTDVQENAWCVNWSIKDSEEGFKRALQLERLNPLAKQKPDFEVIARQQIEEAYYQDGEIPTYFISLDQIDRHVANNLLRLFSLHHEVHELEHELECLLIDALQKSVGSRLAPIDLILDFSARWQVKASDCRTAMCQAIWYRRLRVDLFSEVLMDVPLRQEERDVLDVYGEWFR